MEVKQLDKVAVVARSEEARAASEVQQRQQTVQQSQERLNRLQDFRREYEARLQGISQSGMDARQLADYRRFLAGLNTAIRQQGEELARGAKKLDQGVENLRDRSLRRGSLEDLISRTRASIARDGERRDQQLNDETSLQRYEAD